MFSELRSDLGSDEASILVYEIDGQSFGGKPNRAEFDEIVLITRGFGRMQIGSYEGRFEPGTLSYVRAGTWRSWSVDGTIDGSAEVGALGVAIPSDLVPEAFLRLREAAGLKAFLARIGVGGWTRLSAFDRIQTRIRTLIGARGMLRVARTQALLDLLSNVDDWQVIDDKELSKNQQSDRARFRQVRSYLDSHFRESISRDALAASVGMAPNSFSRFFRRASGTSLSDYVSTLRVRHAATLLVARRRLPVAEIARESGFRNLSVFNLQFRKRLGMTPRSYRRQQDFELDQP